MVCDTHTSHFPNVTPEEVLPLKPVTICFLYDTGSGEHGNSDGVHTGVWCAGVTGGGGGEGEGGEGEGETEKGGRGEETR